MTSTIPKIVSLTSRVSPDAICACGIIMMEEPKAFITGSAVYGPAMYIPGDVDIVIPKASVIVDDLRAYATKKAGSGNTSFRVNFLNVIPLANKTYKEWMFATECMKQQPHILDKKKRVENFKNFMKVFQGMESRIRKFPEQPAPQAFINRVSRMIELGSK